MFNSNIGDYRIIICICSKEFGPIFFLGKIFTASVNKKQNCSLSNRPSSFRVSVPYMIFLGGKGGGGGVVSMKLVLSNVYYMAVINIKKSIY